MFSKHVCNPVSAAIETHKQKQKRAHQTSLVLEQLAKPKEEKNVVYVAKPVYSQVYCFSCGFSHVAPSCD